ncbi:MAG: cation-translocating P-type ATPase [Burkholderiales bacterium]|nr:cation-translocating P-type ATPase [Burkholderiales bacterium]
MAPPFPPPDTASPRASQGPAPDTSAAPTGLSSAQAARRLAQDGPNALPGGGGRSLAAIAIETLREPMFLLLLAAGVLYLAFGDLQEGLTLFGFVVVTLTLTLVQEGRTERAIEALRGLTSPRARVVRDGQVQRIASEHVVRGDLLILAEGDRVPADALLITADGVSVDESMLTGESVPVGKRAADAAEQAGTSPAWAATAAAPARPARRPGGDDQAVVFAGTLVVAGHAQARVTATGAHSEIGRIGAALGTLATERTPLQRQTARLVRQLALLALALSLALVAAHGLLRGDWLQALLAGIALAMAMLPEEYPVVLTVFPALGARRLSREGVLTRRINAIETLGATTVLCTDKTGTLTENRMAVACLVAGGCALDQRLDIGGARIAALPEAFHGLLEVSILASLAEPFDPMEKAFHDLGERVLAHTEHLHRDWTLVRTYGLSPALRAMSHVWATSDGGVQTVAVKGAPEAVADLCHLGPAERARIQAVSDQLAAQGLRVLGAARGTFAGQAWPPDEHGFDVEFVGLLGLADPVRAEVPAAVAECRAAGIRVVMITGDYPATAHAIARQAGLVDGDGAQVLSGDEMERLDDAALQARLAEVRVCARIAPAQKLRIVQALKASGEIVAMTGDGVNDAPALRAAHVGVAMGARGTDVAREASSLVLVDDNFAAIVRAMRLGRRIFDNLRQAMSYILAVHVPIAGMALLPVLFGWPPLLYPMHIALLELIIDPACSVAFENEPEEPDVMQRPPRAADAPLFGASAIGWALAQGLGVLAVVLAGYAWAGQHLPEAEARAFAFATLVLGNLGLIHANRSVHQPLWRALRTPNTVLWWVTGAALAVIGLALYLPWATQLLRFAPLAPAHLALAVGLGALGLAWPEALKWARQRQAQRSKAS